MAAALPVLANRDLNRAKNKKASDEVIPFVYETIIEWGCRKEEDESFGSYYNRREEKLWEDNKGEWEKEVEEKLKTLDMSKWPEPNKKKEKEKVTNKLKEEKEKELLIKETWTEGDQNNLKQRNCKGLDATFLHKLVPTICDGIGRYDPNAPSRTRIEQFLREVKSKRNDICHDPKGASISDTTLDELEKSAVEVFKAAGVLYALTLDQQAVQDKIDELKKRLQTIKEEVMTDDQKMILQTAKKMADDGMAEMKRVVHEQATDFLPFSDDAFTRKDVFHAVTVTIREEIKRENAMPPDDQTIVQIPITEVLQHHDGKAILCEGVPGSGKTTFLRRLREDFFAEGEKLFHEVKVFDLLLYMDCRDPSMESILQLLERTFPRTMNQLDNQKALRALHELNLLICVDGIDELTKNSQKLFNELIRTFKLHGNAMLVCTGRPGRKEYLQLVNHKIVSLQPLTKEEEQIKFLERYQENVKGIHAPELIRAFKALDKSCKDCLGQPIYLALFCFLFRKHGQQVCEWKNELAIMENIHQLSRQTMIDRMREMEVMNEEYYACRATETITSLSVQLLSMDELFINVETYTAMCQMIFQGEKNVLYYPLLSSFFIKRPDRESFEVFHKSYLEFLAAKWLYKKALVSNPSDQSIISTIQAQRRDIQSDLRDGAALSPVVTPSSAVTDGEDVSLKKFENVLRFVCMLLAEGGPPMKEALQRFLEEVCPALAREQVGLDYWTELVLGCPDSDEVARAAAGAARTVSINWMVVSSRAMTGTSRMLCFCQPARLAIEPLQGEDRPETLATLLEAVSLYHEGQLRLKLNESRFNYSACDDVLACLENARCGLTDFHGCLSGDSDTAWRALIGGVKRQQKRVGELACFKVNLLHPRRHELGQLDGTEHHQSIIARPPTSPGDRCRRPLPKSSFYHPRMRVECRPAAGGKAPSVKEVIALIEDLAPNDKKYYNLFLLHYPGSDGALNEIGETLWRHGVQTYPNRCGRNWGWEAHSIYSTRNCRACKKDSSIHQTEERCVEIHLPEASSVTSTLAPWRQRGRSDVAPPRGWSRSPRQSWRQTGNRW